MFSSCFSSLGLLPQLPLSPSLSQEHTLLLSFPAHHPVCQWPQAKAQASSGQGAAVCYPSPQPKLPLVSPPAHSPCFLSLPRQTRWDWDHRTGGREISAETSEEAGAGSVGEGGRQVATSGLSVGLCMQHSGLGGGQTWAVLRPRTCLCVLFSKPASSVRLLGQFHEIINPSKWRISLLLPLPFQASAISWETVTSPQDVRLDFSLFMFPDISFSVQQ